MLGTEGCIDTSENDPGIRVDFANILDDLTYAKVPVGHYGLDKRHINRLIRKEAPEFFTRPAESIKTARNVRERRRLGNELPIEGSTAECIPVARDEIIE